MIPDKVVTRLTDAVSQKLGRPAYCRQVRNRDDWYVYDPVFSFVRRAKGGSGYRVGYRVNFDDDQSIDFTLVHSASLAKLFKHNLILSTLIEVSRATAEFRSSHWVYRSSKLAYRDGRDGDR